MERHEAPLRILLVDDHETVRQGLKLLIEREADLRVVAEAGDGGEAVARFATGHVDVVVMDLSMPGMSGVMATRSLLALRPHLPVVSLTRHAERSFLEELLRAGATAYVLKQSPHAELLRAIRAAASGRQYIDPALTPHLAASLTDHSVAQRRRTPPTVTARENEVLRLVSQGHGNKDIAARLHLSNKTIEVHKANAMRKLGLRGRIELLQYALHAGWLHDA